MRRGRWLTGWVRGAKMTSSPTPPRSVTLHTRCGTDVPTFSPPLPRIHWLAAASPLQSPPSTQHTSRPVPPPTRPYSHTPTPARPRWPPDPHVIPPPPATHRPAPPTPVPATSPPRNSMGMQYTSGCLACRLFTVYSCFGFHIVD